MLRTPHRVSSYLRMALAAALVFFGMSATLARVLKSRRHRVAGSWSAPLKRSMASRGIWRAPGGSPPRRMRL